MTKTIKELFDKSGISNLITYENTAGMVYIDPNESEYNPKTSAFKDLAVEQFSKVIEIPRQVYQKEGQIELYKNRLVAEAAAELLKAIIVGGSTNFTSDSVVSLSEDALEVVPSGATPTQASVQDLLLKNKALDDSLYINTFTADTLKTAETAAYDLADIFVTIKGAPTIYGFTIPDKSYTLYINEEFETEPQWSNNKLRMRYTLIAQGMPTATGHAVTAL